MAFIKRITLRETINNAKKTALRDGYSQVIYLDDEGDYCFRRCYTALNIAKWCKRLCGFVEATWNEHGCQIAIWHSAESNDKKTMAVCEAMAKDIIYY